MEIPKENKGGDCFVAAIDCARQLSRRYKTRDKAVFVCHGIVTGEGPIEGVKYEHAWVEVGNKVYDWSNGNTHTVMISYYYQRGKIEPGEVHRYLFEEAIAKLTEHKHYGPWPEKET